MEQGSVDSADPVTVSNEGITVEKSLTTDEFPVPAVKFVVTTNTASAVNILLTDRIPDSFPMERVGFHPEFHDDSWTVYRDKWIEFEYKMQPDDSLTTVVGIRTEGDSDLRQFLAEPRITQLEENVSWDGPNVDLDMEPPLGPDNSELTR